MSMQVQKSYKKSTHSTCACEINRYLKSIADDLVITCDKLNNFISF